MNRPPNRPYVLALVEPNSRDRIREECDKRGLDARFAVKHDEVRDADCIALDMYDLVTSTATAVTDALGEPVAIINSIEQSAIKAGMLAVHFGVATNPERTARVLRDKWAMKEAWNQAGVRTPASRLIHGVDELDGLDLEYPVIVKPVCGAASAGVRLVTDAAQLRVAARKIFRFNVTALQREGFSRSGLLLEQYIEGPEFAIDCVWVDGVLRVAGIFSKGSPEGPTFPDRLYRLDPEQAPEEASALILEARRAATAAGVWSGATHTELRVDAAGTPWVIEAAFRPGASGGLYATLERGTGQNFFGALVDSALPEALRQAYSADAHEFVWRAPTSRAYWYNLHYEGSGRLGRLEVPEDFYQRHPSVEEVVWRRAVGDYLPSEADSYGYLAWFRGVLEASAGADLTELEQAERDVIVDFA